MQQVSSEFNFDTVHCPTSKSYANRALILAAIKKEEVKLLDLPMAQDVLDMKTTLRAIGLDLKEEDKNIIVKNSFPLCESKAEEIIELNLGEGGTTVRFLLALLAMGKNEYLLEFEGRMKDRPMEDLYTHLRNLGANIKVQEDKRVYLQGPIEVNNKAIVVDCSKTTQFASAFIHLTLESNFKVTPVNVLVSQKYLDLTHKMVFDFRNSNEITIAPDYSSAGYFIAYALMNKDLIIDNLLAEDPYQADSQFVQIVRDIGGEIEFSEKGMLVKKLKKATKGIEIDGSECIDLVPTLAYVASFLQYPSVFKNIEALKYKECDRLEEVLRILSHFNVNCKYNNLNNSIEVHPSEPKDLIKKIEVKPDHRMIMVSVLFLKSFAGGQILPHTNVEKSFPNFFDYFA